MSGPTPAQMVPLVAGLTARGVASDAELYPQLHSLPRDGVGGTFADGLSPVDGSPASDTHGASSPSRLAGFDLLAGVVPPTTSEGVRPVDQPLPPGRLIPAGRNRRDRRRRAAQVNAAYRSTSGQ